MNDELFFKKLEDDGLLVDSIDSIGWALWPGNGHGYLDEYLLRKLADEIERRNKPFWDAYEKACEAQAEIDRAGQELDTGFTEDDFNF